MSIPSDEQDSNKGYSGWKAVSWIDLLCPVKVNIKERVEGSMSCMVLSCEHVAIISSLGLILNELMLFLCDWIV